MEAAQLPVDFGVAITLLRNLPWGSGRRLDCVGGITGRLTSRRLVRLWHALGQRNLDGCFPFYDMPQARMTTPMAYSVSETLLLQFGSWLRFGNWRAVLGDLSPKSSEPESGAEFAKENVGKVLG